MKGRYLLLDCDAEKREVFLCILDFKDRRLLSGCIFGEFTASLFETCKPEIIGHFPVSTVPGMGLGLMCKMPIHSQTKSAHVITKLGFRIFFFSSLTSRVEISEIQKKERRYKNLRTKRYIESNL